MKQSMKVLIATQEDLEFKIKDDRLIQTATFRPLGLLGRFYWFAVLPFHGFIFNGMINKIIKQSI